MSGPASDDPSLPPEESYDSFLREVARVTDGASQAAIMPLAPGARLLGGRFEIERVVGSGGMGVVYAAYDHERGCRVAVKTLRVTTQEERHRLREEFLVPDALPPHPNLVSPGQLFEDDGRCFFSMELVAGVHFLSHVRPDGTLDLARLRSALGQLAAALGFLHAAGQVHRDVKPSNVLCTAHRVVLLDFGLASAGGDSARAGTLPYMAPEQHAGEPTDARTDWYAVGVMLWAALAGRMPFSGDERELAASKRRGAPAIDVAVTDAGDLVELTMALLDPEPARRPSDEAILARLGVPVPARAPVMPFIGRRDELRLLRGAWAAAQMQTARVLVRGPSGVGKSALLAHFGDELRAAGAIALLGRCHERVAMPYKAMHEIASALTSHLRADRDALAIAIETRDVGLLPQVFPALSEIKELASAARAAPAIRDPQQRRSRVFDGFAELVGRLAARTPLALLIDDLQWADRDGLALVRHITVATRSRVLVVAAARDGALDAAAGWPAETCIDVGVLAPADAEELARRLAGDGAAWAIAREATGHPLHIAELARHWRPGQAVPHLDDAIAGRVDELPGEQARVLRLVVIGGALAQDVIGEAAGLDGAAWWRALAALRAANLVRTNGPGANDVVEPYHDCVRESVAQRMARDAVIDGHLRLSGALQARGRGDRQPELLAHHLEGAGRPVEAARWAERAGDQAAHALAFDRAADLYQRALALAAHEPAHAVSLHTRLGDALASAGRGAAAAEAYLAGTALAAGDEVLELRRRAAEQLLRSGHVDEGLGVLDDVLRVVGLPAVRRRRWPIASLVVQRALLRVRRWRGPARRAGSERDRRQLACCWSAVVGMAMTSPLRMAEYHTRHLRLALAAREPQRIALSMCIEAAREAYAGPPATRAHALLEEARSWAAQVDGALAAAYVMMTEGVVAYMCGRWRDALARCEAAERMLRDDCVGVAWEVGTVSHLALSCLWHMGKITELRPRLSRALDDGGRRGDQLRTALQPMVCLMDDREAAARDALSHAHTGLPQREITMQHWQHMESCALVELYAGEPAKAVALVDRQLPALRRAFLMRIYVVHVFTSFLRATAWLGALVAGAPDAARLRTSIVRVCRGLDSHLTTSGVPHLVGAGLAVLDGDLDAAADGYRAAAADFDATDNLLTAEAARWRLGELLGGDEGRALVGRATAALSAEGIVRPDRVMAMLAPVPAAARPGNH